MKKLRNWLLGLVAAMAFAVPAFSQQAPLPSPSESNLHRVGGMYYAVQYASWRGTIVQGNASTGSGQSIVVAGSQNGGIALSDGVTLPLTTVFNTNVPIFIQDYTNSGASETVTPSGVSVGACSGGFVGVGSASQCATITGTFNYSHGASAPVVSGDAGIEEAITDAGVNGGGDVFWVVDTGNVTLNTGGLTTTTTSFVPTQYINFGASARVETTITTSTNWAVGVASHTSAFCTVNSTLTAGTTCIANQVAPTVTGTSTALTAILFTVTGANAGAGAVKARIWGYTPVQAAQ